MRRIVFGFAVLLLAACSSNVVQPGRQAVDGLRVDTPVAWTALGREGQRLWTRDGSLLNALRIYTDVAPGEHVFRDKVKGPADEGARFRAGLGPIEIQELMLDALRAGGMRNVRGTGLRPATLNGRTALQVEIDGDHANGLHYRGMLLVEGEDGSLSYLLFLAPGEHYFERDRDMIEAIFASAR